MKKIIYALAFIFTIIGNSQEIKFGKVSKNALEEKIYPGDSTANAAYLFKKRRTFYEYNRSLGFHVVNYYHYRLKIYNKEGLSRATFKVLYAKPKSGSGEKVSNIKGYTFNLDDNGEIIKTKLNSDGIFQEKINKYRNAKKISMPDVKEGSIIDLKYKLSSPYYFYIDDLSFQSNIPIQKLHTEIETPEWFVFNKISKGFYSIPPKSSKRLEILTLILMFTMQKTSRLLEITNLIFQTSIIIMVE